MVRNTLRGLFTRAATAAPAPVIEVAADKKAAAVELLATQRAVEAAEMAYAAGLLDLSADLSSLDDARRDAARKLDQARALMRAFDEQHVAALAAERRAELDRVIAEASAAQAFYVDLVTNDLPAISVAVRGLLRAWAEAEITREAANRAIAAADAGAPRPSVESFRAWAGRPKRILRTERAELWCDAHGNAANNQDKIRLQPDGTGSFHNPGATYNRKYFHQGTFESSEVLEEERCIIPDLLARTISIPGLSALDNPAWVPLSDPTPERVLAALDRLERQVEASVDTRQPRTVTRLIGPVREIEKIGQTPMLGLHQSM